MPVRLNITIDEDVYRRLKNEVPPKGISAFIEDAVTARFFPDRKTLDDAYRAASRETWRRKLAAEWQETETEDWPG
jgi:predicted CopG family antitoxin